MKKPQLRINILQTGGEVTVGSPLQYVPTSVNPVNPALFKPISLERSLPDVGMDDLPEIEGYTSDKANRYRKFNALKSQLHGLKEYEYSTKGAQIIAEMKNVFNPTEQTRLKNEFDRGQELFKNMGEARNEWLTRPDGTVGMRVLNDDNSVSFQFVDLITAQSLIEQGRGKKVMGAEAFNLRNSEIDLDNPQANYVHDAIGFTSHENALQKEIEQWATTAKNSNSSESEGIQGLNGQNLNMSGTLYAIVGEGGGKSTNEVQYAKAIKNAWDRVSSNNRAVLLNNAIGSLSSLPDDVLKKYGVDGNTVHDLMKKASTDDGARQKINALKTMRAYQLLSEQLERHIGVSTTYKKTVSYNDALTKKGAGVGDWKREEIEVWQGAINGYTDKGSIEIAQVGKDKTNGTKVTVAGNIIPAGVFMKDGKTIPLGQNSEAMTALNVQQMFSPDGRAYTEDERKAILQSAQQNKENTIVGYHPFVNGQPLALGSEQAKLVSQLNVAYSNKDYDQMEKIKQQMQSKNYGTNISYQQVAYMDVLVVDDKVGGLSTALSKNTVEGLGFRELSGGAESNGISIYKEGFPDATLGWGSGNQIFQGTIAIPLNNDFTTRLTEVDKTGNKAPGAVADAALNSAVNDQNVNLGNSYGKFNFKTQ